MFELFFREVLSLIWVDFEYVFSIFQILCLCVVKIT